MLRDKLDVFVARITVALQTRISSTLVIRKLLLQSARALLHKGNPKSRNPESKNKAKQSSSNTQKLSCTFLACKSKKVKKMASNNIKFNNSYSIHSNIEIQ